jgi:hypothetical protein
VAAQRIGLLTLPLHTNYGGIIQAAALRHHLVGTGRQVVLLRRESRRSTKHKLGMLASGLLPLALLEAISKGHQFDAKERSPRRWFLSRVGNIARNVRLLRRKEIHRAFIASAMPDQSRLLYDAGDMARAVDEHDLDAVVVGSDQVWRPAYQPADALAEYFLGFIRKPSVRKIAYAASFGVGHWETPHNVETVSRLLPAMDCVSVREDTGVDLCRSLFGRADASHVLDPTMIVDRSFYEGIAAPATASDGPVLLEYVLDPDPGAATLGQDIAKALGYATRSLLLDIHDQPIDIPHWLRAFMDADAIVTNSYHGMVFAILFRKNFIAVLNKERGGDRFRSLLAGLGLDHRLIDGEDRAHALQLAREPIDYEAADRKLDAWRTRSIAFLAQSLG